MCCDAASGVSQDALTWKMFSCLGCWQLSTRSLKMLCCHSEPNVERVSRFWWEKSFFHPQRSSHSKGNIFFIRSPSLPGPLPPSSPSSRSLSVLCLSSFSGMCSVCVWPKTTLSLCYPSPATPAPYYVPLEAKLECLEAGWHLLNGAWEAPSHTCTHMHTLKKMHLQLVLCVCVWEYWIMLWPCMQNLHYPAEFNSICKNFPTHLLSYFHRAYTCVYL